MNLFKYLYIYLTYDEQFYKLYTYPNFVFLSLYFMEFFRMSYRIKIIIYSTRLFGLCINSTFSDILYTYDYYKI